MKHPRAWVLAAMLVASLIVISPWPRDELVVKYVDSSSELHNKLLPNDVVYRINGKPPSQVDLHALNGKYVTLSTNRGEIKTLFNSTLVKFEKRKFTNLRFGLDLEGGIYAVVEPQGNVSDEVLEDVKATLEKRVSSVRESSFQISKFGNQSFIQIQIAGGTEEELMKLINTTGIFEGKIPLTVKFEENKGMLKVGPKEKWLEVELKNNSIVINDTAYHIHQNFSYLGINFEIVNISSDAARLLATVYRNDNRGKDIVKVYIDPQHSFLQREGDFYTWGFRVEVTEEAAQRFYNVVRNLGIRPARLGEELYLEEKLFLYLDGKEMSNLSISAGLKEKPTTIASVTGSSRTREEAIEERRFLQNILRSGSLPVKLNVLSVYKITPKLGIEFFENLLLAGIVALIAISSVLLLRYRSVKVVSLIIFTTLSEIIIILACSVLIGWTLDLGSLVGIFVVVLTGIEQQVMITDEIRAGKEQHISLRERLNRAFFVIFGSAGTTIGAMLPLMVLGFGMLRGFAITTILGILVGVFITRPVYSELVKTVLEKYY